MNFPIHLHELDVQSVSCLRFVMPSTEVGRGDIEITVEYGDSPKQKDTISFNAWARIGDSLTKGFIHTDTAPASGDNIDNIVAALNNNPAFMETLTEYIEHMTQH